MGTYIRELTEALLEDTNIILYVVNYHDGGYKEFFIETISYRYFKIHIPAPRLTSPQNKLFEKRYASTVVKLLSFIIPKERDIVFQMNYIDDLPIVKKLKEVYKHPVISVVHFAQWQQLFNGNKKMLQGLNIDEPANNIEYTLFLEKEMYKVSDHIVSITRYMKDFLTEHYEIAADKITIVRNGINYNRFIPITNQEKLDIKHRLGFKPSEKIILYSGRIDPAKGIFFLLEAFEELCRSEDNLRLVIIGHGNINECFQKYNSYYGKITFTGFLPLEKVTTFYSVADVGVFPSLFEQCSYTVLAMIANRIPLILSRVDGLNEILDDNQCMFLEPVISDQGDFTFNIKDLSDAILELTYNKNFRDELVFNSYKVLIERFTSRSMAEEMNNLLLNVTNNC